MLACGSFSRMTSSQQPATIVWFSLVFVVVIVYVDRRVSCLSFFFYHILHYLYCHDILYHEQISVSRKEQT